jgi:O-antigen biosynthesis protein
MPDQSFLRAVAPRTPRSSSRVNGEASLADRAVQLAEKRAEIDRLRHDQSNEAEVATQEHAFRLLAAEFRKRVGGVAPHPYDPLSAAAEVADVLRFQVAASHRRRTGWAVTAGKKAFVAALRPAHVETLRRQSAFNEELVSIMSALDRTSGEPNEAAEISSMRARLETLKDPTSWIVRSHRKGARGTAVELLKKSYLRAMRRPLASFLLRQRRFNELAVELVGAISRAPAEKASKRLQELADVVDPLDAPNLHGLVKASRPMWNEVLRRQVAFNREMVTALSRLHGMPPPQRTVAQLDYERWCREREHTTIRATPKALRTLGSYPKIAVLVRGSSSSQNKLDASILSVREQVYREWELWICGSVPAKGRWARDRRIHVASLPVELASTSCEFIVMLTEGDRLAPHALGEVALEADRHDDVDIIYSDEDRIDASGRRSDPFFKPEWSPDLLRAHNYLGGLVAIRKGLVATQGSEHTESVTAQDYNLLLKATEQARRIVHVPSVLYHRGGKPSSGRMEPIALSEHLGRVGEPGDVSMGPVDSLRIRYPIRGSPLVSIIVPFKDKPELLQNLVDSLGKHRIYPKFELLLVSNNSQRPETKALLDRLTDERFRKLTWNHPFNYSAINNFAAKQARGELLLFLNNDVEAIEPGWLEELIGHAQRPDVGAVGPKLLFPDGTIQHVGIVVGLGGFASHPFLRVPDDGRWTPFGRADWTRNYLAVTGACLMMRRELFEHIGGFDERFVVCAGDVDLCLRAVAAGKRIVYTPHARLIHNESATRGRDGIPEGDFWQAFVAYRKYIQMGDPFYNPNLAITANNCSLRMDDLTAETIALQALAQWT